MPKPALTAGLTALAQHTVEAADTAAAIGSGDLHVLGTPRLLAWMEGATCAAIADHLLADETSVGTRVVLEHLLASPVGAVVEVNATVVYVDGRLVRFETVAVDSAARVVGRAEVTRVVVDQGRFLARL